VTNKKDHPERLTNVDSESFAKIQKAVAEPTRLEILEIIRNLSAGQGVSCSQVLAKTDVAQSTFSHHISELIDARLISGVKQGRTMLLAVNQNVVEEYLEMLKLKILGKM
jgi:DNA-binding transcriptional ArsR family regulator